MKPPHEKRIANIIWSHANISARIEVKCGPLTLTPFHTPVAPEPETPFLCTVPPPSRTWIFIIHLTNGILRPIISDFYFDRYPRLPAWRRPRPRAEPRVCEAGRCCEGSPGEVSPFLRWWWAKRQNRPGRDSGREIGTLHSEWAGVCILQEILNRIKSLRGSW